MPINTPIHNTGGHLRFVDYVSLLPEFLREENDVVTLMQIFSDYMNNAYRNLDVASRFEFKLIATEGMVGRRSIELGKLRNLFTECDKRNAPILYLNKPKTPASIVVDYGGDDETPKLSVVPGANGLVVGDVAYIEFTKYPERSGVYKVFNDISGLSFMLDPNGRVQDIFTGTPDKPILSAVGYVPRMMKFYVSDVSDIKSRKIATQPDGTICYEVFFVSTVSDITSVASVDNYVVDGDSSKKYLVDYYNYFPIDYPDEYNSGKFNILTETDITCEPFDIGRGIFYGCELTKLDTRDSVTDSMGINKYIDPSYKYPHLNGVGFTESFNFSAINLIDERVYFSRKTAFIVGDHVIYKHVSGSSLPGLVDGELYIVSSVDPDKLWVTLTDLYSNPVNLSGAPNGVGQLCSRPIPDLSKLFFNLTKPTNEKFLKFGVVYTTDTLLSGDYITRVTQEFTQDFDMSLVDIIENNIILNISNTALKHGDWVKFTTTGTAPTGMTSPQMYQIEKIDGDKVKLKDIDLMSIGSGIGQLAKLKFSVKDVAIIKSYSSGNVVYTSYSGDVISAGEFVVLRGNKPTVLYGIDSTAVKWEPTYGTIYYVGDYVFYGKLRYKVIKTVNIAEINGNPENEGLYYVVDMDSITENGQAIEYNPYMFGSYEPRRLKYNEKIDYNVESFGSLYSSLIVQENEKTGVAFRYPQREWIMNPKISTQTETKRNGWMVSYKSVNDIDTDIANPNAAQNFISPINTSVVNKQITMEFSIPHGLSVGDSIKVYTDSVLTSHPTINGTYVVQIIPTSTTLMYDVSDDFGDVTEVVTGPIKLELADHIHNGSVLFSTRNLFSTSSVNPLNCEAGYYYKYYLADVEWSKYSNRVVPYSDALVDIAGIPLFYGEYSVPLISTPTENYEFYDGLVVNLVNQSIDGDNGYWRVKKNAKWVRLGEKVTIKVRDIRIESSPIVSLDLSDNQIYYKRYSAADVTQTIASNSFVYVAEGNQIYDYDITMPSIEGIDTTESIHTIYDGRYDSNSVAIMPDSFKGIPDMKYPIAEKIERLAYTKDPNVIDFDVISYLARFMGYDITLLSDDVGQSELYTTDEERKTALRKFIQYLPEFNALKSTEKGLECVMLTFGIVGKVVKLWTEASAPYSQFIPDTDLDAYRYMSMDSGIVSNFVPTPHFKVSIDIGGNFPADLSISNISRVRASVINYKPINTVFDGITAYIKANATVGVWMSPIDAKGRIQADVGYNIEFGDIYRNCSI